jgi:two-component system, chemotaxis family, protein-glutamate methylesterase/glutaminase
MHAAPFHAPSLADRRFPVEAVALGASAGGVQALLALLGPLPRGYTLPLVLVLHLPPDRDSALPEVLAARLALQVREARDKEAIAPGTLYIAPPGYHLLVETDRTLSLSCDPPLHFSRPSIDMLFESAAVAYGQALAGVVLTGANEDGAEGLACIHRHGGLTVVQDPAEAQIATMPQAAIGRHRPDFILRLSDIQRFLLQLGSPA